MLGSITAKYSAKLKAFGCKIEELEGGGIIITRKGVKIAQISTEDDRTAGWEMSRLLLNTVDPLYEKDGYSGK